MGLDGFGIGNLCRHCFQEHRFAVLITAGVDRQEAAFFYRAGEFPSAATSFRKFSRLKKVIFLLAQAKKKL